MFTLAMHGKTIILMCDAARFGEGNWFNLGIGKVVTREVCAGNSQGTGCTQHDHQDTAHDVSHRHLALPAHQFHWLLGVR